MHVMFGNLGMIYVALLKINMFDNIARFAPCFVVLFFSTGAKIPFAKKSLPLTKGVCEWVRACLLTKTEILVKEVSLSLFLFLTLSLSLRH